MDKENRTISPETYSAVIKGSGNIFALESAHYPPFINKVTGFSGMYASASGNIVGLAMVRDDPEDAPNSVNIYYYFTSALVSGRFPLTDQHFFKDHRVPTLPTTFKLASGL